ncbi:MAG: hypothetical protein QW343_01850 [Candidatus Norongarragalinales archaeon]
MAGVKYLDDLLRRNPIGVWHAMPEAEELDYSGKPHNRGLGRIDGSALWRVGTRKEIIEWYKHTMNGVYKNLILAGFFLVAALVCFSLFTTTKDVVYALAAVFFAAFCSRHYTKAWGGYAGGWSDYELDPVQVSAQSSYVIKNGFGLM